VYYTKLSIWIRKTHKTFDLKAFYQYYSRPSERWPSGRRYSPAKGA
jgi:hypothetical protein